MSDDQVIEEPVFEVRVGDRHYHIWASGRTEGFKDGDLPVVVFNRIPQRSREHDITSLMGLERMESKVKW